ncbi:MAG: hypothetical protein RL341_1514 [Pseudomonadota bacterium]|jgi:predicted nucleic acid-binding protein
MILVDASVWIDFFNGKPCAPADELERLLDDASAPVAIADLTLYEVLRGFRAEKDALAAQRLLAALEVIDVGGEDNARSAVDHFRALRRLGYTNNSIADVMLASYCIAHDHALLHADQDFDAFAQHRGLKVWQGPAH